MEITWNLGNLAFLVLNSAFRIRLLLMLRTALRYAHWFDAALRLGSKGEK
jgi:hypothetical protein